ncbi:MAG: FHA domain-containing protein [Pseudomonadales bacterium]
MAGAATVNVLEPTFDQAASSALGTIALDGAELVIGRDETPFTKLPDDLRAQLRPRHARIVREPGGFILVNEGSAVGTRLNGEPVIDASAPLQIGDRLLFGESLAFEFRGAAALADPEGTQLLAVPVVSARLLLSPRSSDGPAEPLAINAFPFLISKTEGAFAQYARAHTSALSFLSRRHARIVERSDGLYVEDLGSTNGTQLNGSLLRQAALPLHSGDQLCFGHRDFTFDALVSDADVTAVQGTPVDPEGTVLISSARPFLELYCDTGDASGTRDETNAGAEAGVPTGGPTVQASWRDRLAAAPGLADALRWWHALPLGRWPRLAIVCALPLLAISLLLATLFADTRPERIRELLQAQRPRDALVIAANYLADHPEDAVAPGLLAEAYEAHLVPRWLTAMRRDDIADAKLALADAFALAPGQVDDPLSTLLNWMTALTDYAGNNAGQAIVSLVHDNQGLQHLLQHWDSRSDVYERLLRRLEETSPELAEVHTETLSRLRSLQEDGAVLLGAVDDLWRRLADDLNDGRLAAATDRLNSFDQEYPGVADRDRFRADLALYTALLQARDRGDLEAYVRASRELPFNSAFFRARQQVVTADVAEAGRVNTRLQDATGLWRRGQLDDAIAALTGGEPSRWAGTLARKKARFESVLKRFRDLQALVDSPRYAGALIDLYATLDPAEDVFIHDTLGNDFESQREKAIQRAQTLTAIAAQSWASYRDAYDGVSGGLRLEPEVSDSFRRQVLLLGAAYADIDQSLQLYRLLEVDGPEEAVTLHSQVVVEIRQQRNALEALRTVLDRNVVEEKLRLLPVVGEPRA